MFDAILLYKGDAEFVAMLLVGAAALAWGGSPERASAGSIAFMFLAEIPHHWIFGAGSHFSTVDPGNMFIDLVTSCMLLGTALHANRNYTLWLAALQLISLASHVIRLLDARMLPLSYAIMSIAPSYLELIVLSVGLVSHARRIRRHGPYRSWRNSSFPSRELAALASPNG